ncbi:11902_t:CDS:2 [Diversispora eburnea]|uniref:11902_t:CDS:1 n=1 Tax=Diversispora eburnea TaxID=1213867 RepID=A0A9N9A7W5_9GLOM|nr:11902_t:CDS:2 [Diversispora eburnea]
MEVELLSGLSRDLSWLLEDSNDHNILIHTGEIPNTKTFKAHTNILRSRSLYFRAVLSSKLFIQSNPVIDTEWNQTNISPEIFEVMLNGEINVGTFDTQKLLDFLLAADILWLYELLDNLQDYLVQNRQKWIQNNFVRVYSMLYSRPTTFKKLQLYLKSILSTQPSILFDSPQYSTLTLDMMISLLKKDYLVMEESEIWIKILNWGIKQNSEMTKKSRHTNILLIIEEMNNNDFMNLQKTLFKLFPLIKFKNMSYNDFIEKVQPFKPILP